MSNITYVKIGLYEYKRLPKIGPKYICSSVRDSEGEAIPCIGGSGGSVWVMGKWSMGQWMVCVIRFQKMYVLYGIKQRCTMAQAMKIREIKMFRFKTFLRVQFKEKNFLVFFSAGHTCKKGENYVLCDQPFMCFCK